MTEQELFIKADEALVNIIEKIKPDHWSMNLPDWFQTGQTQHDPTLRDIINYHAFDEAWVPDDAPLQDKLIALSGRQP